MPTALHVPLYAADSVRASLGACLRPGGLDLTRRALELVNGAADSLNLDWRILDAGCGPGGTLEYLRSQGFTRAMGLDLATDLLEQARNAGFPLIRASLDGLPIRSRALDMVLCECALNLAQDPASVLGEFHRMLSSGGWLVVSDIFVRRGREPDWPVTSCFARARRLEDMRVLFEDAGFRVLHVEDHTRLLKETAARLVFEHGSLEGFWETVTGQGPGGRQAAEQAVCTAKKQMPGLYLAVATPI